MALFSARPTPHARRVPPPSLLGPRGSLVAGCLALASAGCGARSGLWVPCTIEVQPGVPQIVVVADHSALASAHERGLLEPDGGDVRLPDGTFATVHDYHDVAWGLGDLLPVFDADPLTPTALGLGVYPNVGRATLEREGYCSLPSALVIPLTAHGASAVVAQTNQWNNEFLSGDAALELEPAGGAPVDAALAVARRALDAAPANAPRFVVLAGVSQATCGPPDTLAPCDCYHQPVAECEGAPGGAVTRCSNADRAVAAIAALREADIRTLVVTIEITGSSSPAQYDRRFLAAAATAGGLGRAGTWYELENDPGLREVVQQRIVPSGWCYPHVAPQRDPDEWALQSRHGTVPRDPSHHEGWDWVDAQAGELRVYGAACEAAIADHGGLVMASNEHRCTR